MSEPTVLRRDPPKGQPPHHWFFDQFREYHVPGRFTLDLEGGLVVGRYAAHITAGGILDYETSDYFGVRGWEEHPLFLRRRLPAPQHVKGTVVSLATRGTERNYYHALMDLAARWGVFQECYPDIRPDALVVNTTESYHRDLVRMFELDRFPLIESSSELALSADRLLVPCLPNPATLAPPWITSFLSTHLPSRSHDGLPERLYVTRGHRRNTRRLVEESELLPHLTKMGFAVFDPGAVSVQEQIDHFAAARVIVAPHGAGLTNMNFCRPGVRLLELFAARYLNPGFWAITSNIPESHYRYLVADSPRPLEHGSSMRGIQQDIRLPVNTMLEALEDLLAS